MVVTPTGKYKTGTCDVTVPFPDTSATYSYKMVVTPGRVDVPAGFGTGSSLQISMRFSLFVSDFVIPASNKIRFCKMFLLKSTLFVSDST